MTVHCSGIRSHSNNNVLSVSSYVINCVRNLCRNFENCPGFGLKTPGHTVIHCKQRRRNGLSVYPGITGFRYNGRYNRGVINERRENTKLRLEVIKYSRE